MFRITRTLLAGFLLLLPIVITGGIVIWLVSFLQTFVGPSSAVGRVLISIGLGLSASSAVAYLFGILIVAAFVYVLGLLVESRLRPWLQSFVDRIMRRIPLISNVYDVSKRFVAIVDRNDSGDLKGMTPVWCFFGGEQGAAVLALLPTSEPVFIGEQRYQAVLIPSAPLPFGGCLIYVPSQWLHPASGGVEELMNVYVSMGVNVPSPPELSRSENDAPPTGPKTTD